MKLKTIFFFAFLSTAIFAQENKFTGTYTGKLDTVVDGYTSQIFVKLLLNPNKTFKYEIKGTFSGCTSNNFSCTGQWLEDGGWIYFKPNPNKEGTIVFVMNYPVKSEDMSQEELDKIYKHEGEKYDNALKIADENTTSPKLFLRIGYDCFKQVWKNKAIVKTK